MIVLDGSPLEALAFNYVSFGFFTIVNNLWTWVAVVTAAISFWRIRATAGTVSSDPPPCIGGSKPIVSETHQHSEIHPTPATPPPVGSGNELPAEDAPPSLSCNDGVTKGKFIAYYENEGEREGESAVAVGSEWGFGVRDGREEWWGSWERVLRVKMGTLGWSSYQDMTVINGNVVRLWDEVRSGKYCTKCAVW